MVHVSALVSSDVILLSRNNNNELLIINLATVSADEILLFACAKLYRCAPLMTFTLEQLTKDTAKIDFDDILSCWKWRLTDMQAVLTVSNLGDIFLLGNDGAVYWLQTDTGKLTKVAETLKQYQRFLSDEEKIDEWFLPLLVEKLLAAGKTLKDNEVYSHKTPPFLGGDYSLNNIEPTDISVHFALSGQIYEQVKDLPDGTKVNIKYER
jgi:hypothetical protein